MLLTRTPRRTPGIRMPKGRSCLRRWGIRACTRRRSRCGGRNTSSLDMGRRPMNSSSHHSLQSCSFHRSSYWEHLVAIRASFVFWWVFGSAGRTFLLRASSAVSVDEPATACTFDMVETRSLVVDLRLAVPTDPHLTSPVVVCLAFWTVSSFQLCSADRRA